MLAQVSVYTWITRKMSSNGVQTILLIALAKPQIARVAAHQPAFMGSCLTIRHTCLPCLPSRWVSPCVPGVIEGSEDAVLV